MATSTTGINIGDATFSILIDLTNLNQGLAQINTDIPAKLKSSNEAAAGLGKSFSDAGNAAQTAGTQIAAGAQKGTTELQKAGTQATVVASSLGKVADAAQKLPPAVAPLADAVASVGQKAATSGTQISSAFTKAGSDVHRAAGEVGLLGEATGVVLPRHIRTFLAELPGVGAALSAAFAATAVLFLIEAVITAGEKLEEFEKKPQAIEDAWRDVGDATANAGRTMQTSLDAAQAKIIGLTQGPLAQMDYEILHIGSDAEKVAGLVGTIGAALVKALQEQDTSKANLLSFFLPNSRDVTEQAQQFVAQLQSVLLQSGNQAGLVSLKAQLEGLDAEIKKTSLEFTQDAAKIGTALDVIEGRPAQAASDVFKTRLDSLNRYKQSLLDLQNIVQKGIELDASDKESAALERRRQQGELLAAEAKRDLDADLANIEVHKSAQHLAFVSGETDAATWAVAQQNATDAATAGQERYLARLVDIYKQSGDVVKAQSTAQELATAQTLDGAQKTEALAAATQKYHEATLKIVKDWEDLQNKSIAKNFEEAQQAAQRLTQEELKLGDAQKKLQETQIKSDFSAQENAITQLANFGIITEAEKAQRLEQLYQQEEVQALSALKDLLAKEQAAVQAAQDKLDAGKLNPVLTDAQLSDLQINLDRLKVAYTNTQSEIVSTQAQFDQKRLALDKGYFAESVALALAAGKDDLAAGLQLNKSYLDQIDSEIRLATARGQDTAALKAQRAEILTNIKNLESEAKATKDLGVGIDSTATKFARFLNNFQHGSVLVNLFDKDLASTSQEMRNFGQISQSVLGEFGSAWESAISSAILGQQTFGKALEQATADVAAQIAAQALLYGVFYTAQGIADIFWDPPRAGADFAAAAEFFALGGAAAGVAVGLNQGSSSSAGSGGGSSTGSPSTPGQTSPTQTPQQPVQTVNAQRLGTGGLITQRTLAVIGDAATGPGSQREAVIPVDNPQFMDAVAGAIADRLGNGGSTTHNNFYIDGVISPDNLNKVMRKMNRVVTKGAGRTVSSNSLRVTKRG